MGVIVCVIAGKWRVSSDCCWSSSEEVQGTYMWHVKEKESEGGREREREGERRRGKEGEGGREKEREKVTGRERERGREVQEIERTTCITLHLTLTVCHFLAE